LRIAVNTRLLIEKKLEGIGWFTFETLKRITKAHPEHEFIFLFDRPYSEKYVFNSNVKAVKLFPPARHPFLWYTYFEYSVPYALKRYKADAFISPDGHIPVNPSVKTLNVMHDINFEHRPQDLPFLVREYYRRHFPKFATNATRLATVSEYSKQDLVNTYKLDPGKIDVVYNGCNELYSPSEEELQKRTRNKYSSGRPYFLYVGSMHPRKNVVNLLRAFELFKRNTNSDMKLVMVGEYMWGSGEIGELLQKLTSKNDIFFLGKVKSEELKNILGAAYALTYVPFFEGFGIPILEAFASDLPVIASGVTSLPEVAGDAALYVEPDSIESIAGAMAQLTNDPLLRTKLVEAGRKQKLKFSWDKTADLLWKSFEKTVE